MEPDFRGYATKAGVECTDGRTIMPGAFRHQDQTRVPLVWQHNHGDPMSVVGHAILEDRPDGTYAYGFFNKTEKANHVRELLEHGDVNMMSIWANQLIERGRKVIHGAIREVSLVLAGANPGAVIENVTIRHDDGDEYQLEDEVVITSGEVVEHGDLNEETSNGDGSQEETESEEIQHSEDGPTMEEVYDTLNDDQKKLLHAMLGELVASDDEGELKQSADDEDDNTVQHTDKEGSTMSNVFEQNSTTEVETGAVLSHSEVQAIVADAARSGSLRSAVEGYALKHGIEDIEVLFPEAQMVGNTPEWDKRRTEWVSGVLNGVTKRPFSRIKTVSADLTLDQARAKGYVKGTLKKEEFFRVSKRITTPTTIYKKQKLDRDDILDITDFDVVMWMKGEMRLMLDEELARAILIGDGRAVDDEDKVNEDNIRPIARDHELFTTRINVNLGDAESTVQEIIDKIVANRRFYKGSGMPTMYTTETIISQFLLLKDSLGRRLYKNLDEIASELRVAAIVPVEVMEEDPEVVAVLVNLTDYSVGADKGGSVAMFDDFDIDYNQNKYLIETRVSGALTKVKSALVVVSVAGSLVLATPEEPGFNEATGVVTIPTVTGVVYEDDAAPGVPLTPGAQSALSVGESMTVNAVADTGYYFETSAGDSWTFTREA